MCCWETCFKKTTRKRANSAVKCCSSECAVEKHVARKHAIPRRCLATCLVALYIRINTVNFLWETRSSSKKTSGLQWIWCMRTIQSPDWLLQSQIRSLPFSLPTQKPSSHPPRFLLPARGIFMNWRALFGLHCKLQFKIRSLQFCALTSGGPPPTTHPPIQRDFLCNSQELTLCC